MLISSVRSKSIGAGALLLSMWAISGIGSFAEAPAPTSALETPVAPEAPSTLSPAAEKARATVEGYPAERERILAELEEQSLEETISQALHVWPSDAFTMGYSRGPFVNDRQKYLLQDPRLARILHAAVNGTEEERAVIRAQVVQIIDEMLVERQKRDAGLDYDENLLKNRPGKEIYPLVLAEVDREGTSLPLLLKWYDADRGPGWTEAQLRALEETTQRLGGPSGRISDAARGDEVLIAAAARLIAEKMGEPLHEGEGTVLDPLGDGGWVFPGGRQNVSVVDELSGYALFDPLMLFECDQLMNTLRARLQEPAAQLPVEGK